MKRLYYIDNLKALMIILVVILHSAVTYSGMGGWYYKENESVDTASTLFFAFYLTFTQAYFMSMFFMISGYFTQKSLERKSIGKFLSGRLFRLGIPLLIYIFILHPLSVKLAYPEIDILDFYKSGLVNLRFFSWTGPLWFVEALLIFNIIYLIIRPIFIKFQHFRFDLNTRTIILLIILITAIAFLTRLAFPIGSDVTNLQLGFFPAYLVMFFTGVIGYKHDVFDKIDYQTGIRWLIIALVIGIPFWGLIIMFGGPMEGKMLIEGGMNWPAFLYALWESFFCVTFIIALVGIFKHRFNRQNSLQRFLSDQAFGVFVFHAPVLIGISMLLKEVTLHPILKFAIVSFLAVTASFLVSWLVRQVKPFKVIFS
jgi:surface polysaccharide O-acyltransferase-like enzyme